jgi:predicted transcriptional regulator with HTH domain
MTCVCSCIQMHVRVAVIGNGIGQVQQLNYLCDIQRRIEQGKSLEATVCMDVLNIRYSGRTSLIILTTT